MRDRSGDQSQKIDRPEPRFRVGQHVHVWVPLMQSFTSTWIREREIEDPGHAIPSLAAVSQVSRRLKPLDDSTEADDIGEDSDTDGSRTIGYSDHDTEEEHGTAVPNRALEMPVAQVYTRKHIPSSQYVPSFKEVPHCNTWKIIKVVEGSAEHPEWLYELEAVERVKCYVAESGLALKKFRLGDFVKKIAVEFELWAVMGLSIRDREVWVDIIDGQGKCELVKADTLRALDEMENRAAQGLDICYWWFRRSNAW